MSAQPSEKRQAVRFAFYKLDGAWRRLSADRQAASKLEFGEVIESFHGRLLLRPYGLVGIRGDCDFLLWQGGADPGAPGGPAAAPHRPQPRALLAISSR